jgi:hypothetical protein
MSWNDITNNSNNGDGKAEEARWGEFAIKPG